MYACDVHGCPYRHERKTNLVSHLYHTHRVAGPYKCSQCPRSFQHRREIGPHVFKQHGRAHLSVPEGQARLWAREQVSDRADRCLIRPAAPPIAAPAAPAAPAGPVVLAGAAAHALGPPPLPPLPPAPPGLVAPPALAPFAPATLPPPGHSATGAMLQDGWSNGPYWYLAYYSENELVCWNEGQLLGALPVLPPLVVRWPGQELWPATHPGWYAMPGGDAIWHHGQADELRLW